MQSTIDPAWGSEISQMINSRQKKNESTFAVVWSRIILVINTYNFFTCFFWMGIPGYPFGIWYLSEILSEVLIMFNFCTRLILKKYFKSIWQEMYLLHDYKPPSKTQYAMRFYAAIP